RSKRDWSSDVCSSDLTAAASSWCLLVNSLVVTTGGLPLLAGFRRVVPDGLRVRVRRYLSVLDLRVFATIDIAGHGDDRIALARRSEERRVGKRVRARC